MVVRKKESDLKEEWTRKETTRDGQEEGVRDVFRCDQGEVQKNARRQKNEKDEKCKKEKGGILKQK